MEIRKFIETTLKKSGKIAMKYYGKNVNSKQKTDQTDIVTEADMEIHHFIVKEIKKKFPGHDILSEEDKNGKLTIGNLWIIDPIDGTWNFFKCVPHFAPMIAYAENGIVKAGGIYFPVFKELFYGEIGKGAFLNGKKIKCDPTTELKSTVGNGYFFELERNKESSKKIIKMITTHSLWCNHFGSSCSDLTLVAAGRRSWVIFAYMSRIWDAAPAIPILRESGCKVTNLEGNEWTMKDHSLLAANPILHKKMMKAMK